MANPHTEKNYKLQTKYKNGYLKTLEINQDVQQN